MTARKIERVRRICRQRGVVWRPPAKTYVSRNWGVHCDGSVVARRGVSRGVAAGGVVGHRGGQGRCIVNQWIHEALVVVRVHTAEDVLFYMRMDIGQSIGDVVPQCFKITRLIIVTHSVPASTYVQIRSSLLKRSNHSPSRTRRLYAYVSDDPVVVTEGVQLQDSSEQPSPTTAHTRTLQCLEIVQCHWISVLVGDEKHTETVIIRHNCMGLSG